MTSASAAVVAPPATRSAAGPARRCDAGDAVEVAGEPASTMAWLHHGRSPVSYCGCMWRGPRHGLGHVLHLLVARGLAVAASSRARRAEPSASGAARRCRWGLWRSGPGLAVVVVASVVPPRLPGVEVAQRSRQARAVELGGPVGSAGEPAAARAPIRGARRARSPSRSGRGPGGGRAGTGAACQCGSRWSRGGSEPVEVATRARRAVDLPRRWRCHPSGRLWDRSRATTSSRVAPGSRPRCRSSAPG
jgi:hypothetical protein